MYQHSWVADFFIGVVNHDPMVDRAAVALSRADQPAVRSIGVSNERDLEASRCLHGHAVHNLGRRGFALEVVGASVRPQVERQVVDPGEGAGVRRQNIAVATEFVIARERAFK